MTLGPARPVSYSSVKMATPLVKHKNYGTTNTGAQGGTGTGTGARRNRNTAQTLYRTRVTYRQERGRGEEV